MVGPYILTLSLMPKLLFLGMHVAVITRTHSVTLYNFQGDGIDTNFDDKIVHEHVTNNGKKCWSDHIG